MYALSVGNCFTNNSCSGGTDELAPRGMIRFVTWIKWGAAPFIFKPKLFHTRSFNQEFYFLSCPCFHLKKQFHAMRAVLSYWLTLMTEFLPHVDDPLYGTGVGESETNYEMHYMWIYNESSCQEISTNLIKTGTTCVGTARNWWQIVSINALECQSNYFQSLKSVCLLAVN